MRSEEGNLQVEMVHYILGMHLHRIWMCFQYVTLAELSF